MSVASVLVGLVISFVYMWYVKIHPKSFSAFVKVYL